jgi:hypothetical protein
MSQAPAVLEEQQMGEGIFTVRAMLLGAFLCLVVSIADPYWTFYLHSSTLFLDYSVGGAMFLLFLAVLLVNGLIGMVWRKLALRPGELVVATAMMLVAGAISTMGLTGYLIPTITTPYSLADSSNNWEQKLWPHLPAWAAPLDRDGGIQSILLFDQGMKGVPPVLVKPWTPGGLIQSARNFVRLTASMPWGPWLMPLVYWGIFLTALYACMVCVMTLMRKQWVDYERLTFPIAQVPQELCATAAAPWARGSLLRNKLFWIGFAVPFTVGTLTALKKFYPWVPTVPQRGFIRDIGPKALELYLSFAVLGFTFLIPNRVAFSLWVLNLVSFAFRSILMKYGLEMRENLGLYGAADYPIMAHQGMGAMLVFVAGSLYFARRHIQRVLACAAGDVKTWMVGVPLLGLCAGSITWWALGLKVGNLLIAAVVAAGTAAAVGLTIRTVCRAYGPEVKEQRLYDATEPSSYGTAITVLLISLGVMACWLTKAGLPLFYTIVFLGASLLIFYGITRVVAQCGLSVAIAPMMASPFMATTFGGANIVAKGFGTLTYGWVWMSDIRTTVMSSAAHGMYLTRRKGRGLFPLLMLAAAITFVVATLAGIWLGYRHGAANLHSWFFIDGPKYTFKWALEYITTSKPPNYAGYFWSGVGAAIMAGLILAQRSLLWWPMHPVGFIVCSIYWTDVLWLTIFLAWAIKLLVTRLGGNRLLRRARLFFLGMILGQFTVAGVWAIYDTLTNTLDHSIFWI